MAEETAVGADDKPATPDVIPVEEDMILRNLLILPPLQREGTLTRDERVDAVKLPAIRPEEPVASLRAVLSEVCGYAHLTNYRFVLEESPPSEPEPAPASPSPELVSPYTGPNAIVSVPCSIKNLDKEPQQVVDSASNVVEPTDGASLVLDEFGDLTMLLNQGLKDGSAFRIVLERYDVAQVRDHVVRLRSLLDGNAPYNTSLDVASEEPAENGDKPGKESPQEAQADEEQKKDKDSDGKPPSKPPKVYAVSEERSIAVNGSNLKDFFYLACGEEEILYDDDSAAPAGEPSIEAENLSKSKKKKNKAKKKNDEKSEEKEEEPRATKTRKIVARFNELEETTRVNCNIRFSGFHPPPSSRRLMGDLCYLEVTPPAYPKEPIFYITAIPTGFYVNLSKFQNGQHSFNPAPAEKHCFSHELLDCILQASDSLRNAWAEALVASKERAELTTSSNNSGLFGLFRVAVRGDFGGYESPSSASASQGIDSVILRPPWLVPLPRDPNGGADFWTYNSMHTYSPARMEDEISNFFGLDIRGGALRDWNEEIQSAREMPRATLIERIDRARVIHKVLGDFGEAAVVGVMAICDGHVSPMNPNEPVRSHVYLHNNIFFSRAVDSGVETFKLSKGDKAQRKAASRDTHSVSTLHRMDVEGLFTLATVLVDYLGTRFVCQSVVPGILHGEKTHTLLYGAVEATSPLAWDEDMHKLLEDTLGSTLMVATRTVPTNPLTDERMAEIERLRTTPILPTESVKNEKNDSPLTKLCGPVEGKGIMGSDKRKYVLDMNRLSPRDANWVPKSEGGSGKWEAVMEDKNGKHNSSIPETLEDDEWIMAVLRPELVTAFIQSKLKDYLEKKEADKALDDEEDGDTDTGDKDKSSPGEKASELSPKKKLDQEDDEYLKSLKFNVNVFLPDMKTLAGLDDEAAAQLKQDEERVREISSFLWDSVLPKLTVDIREASGTLLPSDGAQLTELLHQRGINCRYLGRLAALAAMEEEKDETARSDVEKGTSTRLPRRVMPHCWLEMLECEMVARAAKHVLDSYLSESGGVVAAQPVQMLASFLSAVVSTGEETAADTENRIQKEAKDPSSFIPQEDDLVDLTLVGTGGDDVDFRIRSRSEVWEDMEKEIARRFRYQLVLFKGNKRASRAPLLRRICQRTGIRLVAKKYALGGKSLCGDGSLYKGGLACTYPISPVDIIDVLPLVKHAAAHGGEFVPVSKGPRVVLPSLHILLPDAKAVFEAAHVHFNRKALPQALDLAQEASALYQRVTDTHIHVNVARCLELTSAILFEAKQLDLAAANASRSLALAVQLGGFDSTDVLTGQTNLFHILLSCGRVAEAARNLRASLYLTELLAGPHHATLAPNYHRLGQVYHETGDFSSALRSYNEAGKRQACDRVLEGLIRRHSAVILAQKHEYKAAVDMEKRAYLTYSQTLGETNELTRNSKMTLQALTKVAVDQGSQMAAADKQRKEEEVANAIASELSAEEEEETKKKKKKTKGKKK